MTQDGAAERLLALVAAAREGQPRAVGRLISLVENESDLLPQLTATLVPDTGRALVVGLTGAPGVGKSTVTNALVRALRRRGERVGVLAVDPSSPFSGGAVLGDRIRMQEHALDPDVFIRSMATRGHLGGLATAVPQALRVFDAAGCAYTLLETVGVGQSEVAVAATADVTLVLLAPGAGDGVQAAKAGILEVGDVFVVNKSDRDGASVVVSELRQMLGLGARPAQAWTPPIVTTVASEGAGIDELLDAVDRFAAHQGRSGAGRERRVARARGEVEQLVLGAWRRRDVRSGGDRLTRLAGEVADGRLDPYAAADRLLDAEPGRR